MDAINVYLSIPHRSYVEFNLVIKGKPSPVTTYEAHEEPEPMDWTTNSEQPVPGRAAGPSVSSMDDDITPMAID